MAMTSSKPYMVRALHEWIVDNGLTPHLLVDAFIDGVEVPQEFVNKEGRIVLNISPDAAHQLNIDNEYISFSARFAKIPRDIFVPWLAVLGIYARENGQGMIFEPDPNSEPPPPPPPKNKSKNKSDKSEASTKPSLKIVK